MLTAENSGRDMRAETMDDIVDHQIDFIQEKVATETISTDEIPEHIDQLIADGLITEGQADEIGDALSPLGY